MAEYSAVRSKHATLVASTEDTVTLSGSFEAVEVVNRDGADEITFTVAGETVAALDDDAYVLPAAVSSRKVQVRSLDAGIVVKLISAGTPKYSVIGID